MSGIPAAKSPTWERKGALLQMHNEGMSSPSGLESAKADARPYPFAWSETATQDDIYFCYRLLLGRDPDPGGYTTYSAVIRSRPVPVRELVEMFVTSLEYRQQHQHTVAAVPEKVDVHGFQMYASPEDWAVGKFIIQHRSHEPHVTEAVRNILKPGMVAVDIGANIGYFTLLAASIVGPAGRVYAFEPNPSNCALIQLSAEVNHFEHVELFPFALADKPRMVILNSSASTGSTRPLAGIEEFATSTVLRAVSLDATLPAVQRLDVLKIDIDGGEGLAMRGAANTIRRHKPAIFTEFSPGALQNFSSVTGPEYLKYLLDFGYDASVITVGDGVVACGTDTGLVMDYFHKAEASHIDLLLTAK